MYDSDFGITNEKYFRVSPLVIPADKESTVTIVSLDDNFKFFDDITYEVTVIPKDNSDVPPGAGLTGLTYEKSRKIYRLKPQNGELKVNHYFCGEQEWFIHISTKEYEIHQNPIYGDAGWPWLTKYPRDGINIAVYSLSKRLYGKIPLKGDLHIHTSVSDGHEGADVNVACYRRAGFDFLAITDHYLYNDGKALSAQFDFVKGLTILPGEETHNVYGALVHMVNIGSRYSVNDLFLNHRDYIEKEIELARKNITVPEGLNEDEYLCRAVLYNEIKKSGGLAIFPHPCWQCPERFNSDLKMSMAVLEHGLCDVLELVGGCTPEGNNLQLAIYNGLCAEGKNYPIVASSDGHSVLKQPTQFNEQYTILFADSREEIINAITDKNSVAVEAIDGEHVRIYGDFSLVKYAHFLRRCYYPKHDALCRAAGELLLEYVYGDEDMKSLVIGIEEKIEKFNKEIFG